MEELFKILPYIVGAAISPVLLVTTLLILAQSSKPISKAIAFLIGSAITISAICVFVFYSVNIRSTPPGTKEVFPHTVIGLLLLLLALDIYRRGPAKPKKTKTKHKGLIGYLLLGIVLMLTNITTIAMVVAIAVELHSISVSSINKLTYTITTIVSSLLPILLPLIVLALAGKHSKNMLNTLSSFMKQYAHIVTAIFFALLGLFSLAKVFL